MRKCVFAVAIAATFGVFGSAQGATFTAGGFTFEQNDTPDQLSLLGDGATIAGATFSAGGPTRITSSVAFPPNPAGFDPALSLGRQGNAQAGLTQSDGSSCSGACAINMPDGNDGTATRHGLEISWSGNRALTNGAGDDFVIYESASSSTGDEGFMVRVGTINGVFSGWRFEAFDAFESYTGGSSGAMATAFDISDFGLISIDPIGTIQIANLIASDTIGANGSVLFDGSGSPHGFGSGSLDPDPLYVGALSSVSTAAPVPLPATLPLAAAGLGLLGLIGVRRRKKA